MNFWQFRNQFYDLVCFNVNQVYAWKPDFEKNNLVTYNPHSPIIFTNALFLLFPSNSK